MVGWGSKSSCKKFEKDLVLNGDWEIEWQMVFSAIKCKVLQMEENNADFKYAGKKSQLTVSAHSQLYISAQQ